jgi:hypothetical protein
MLRSDLHHLARARAADARVLLKSDRYDAACYIAGLAVECALKACIASTTARYEFPDKHRAQQAWAHDLKQLSELAGLRPVIASAPQLIRINWAIVINWKVDIRYQLGKSKAEATDFVQAAVGRGGMVPWLRQQW